MLDKLGTWPCIMWSIFNTTLCIFKYSLLACTSTESFLLNMLSWSKGTVFNKCVPCMTSHCNKNLCSLSDLWACIVANVINKENNTWYKSSWRFLSILNTPYSLYECFDFGLAMNLTKSQWYFDLVIRLDIKLRHEHIFESIKYNTTRSKWSNSGLHIY
jgi:hypothetical protein